SADAQQRLADPDRPSPVDYEARHVARAAVEESPVDAAKVLGDELSGLVAEHPQMMGGNIGIVDDHVILVTAANAGHLARDTHAGSDVAMTGENLDPDHLLTR